MWRELSLLLLSLAPCLPLYTNKEVTQYDLLKICRKDGQKKDLFLGSLGAFVFNLNSSVGTRLDCHLEVHHKITTDKNLGFRVFIDWMEVEETAGCSGDYLQFGRDTFIITDRKSPKFCNKIPSPIVEKDSEGRVKGWDFRMVSKQSRTWIEEKDYEFDIWLNLRPSSTVKGLRLIVTPFRKSCSEQDVRIQRYSHCNNDAGRCHNTELFCKQLVKCGTLDQESWDRACTDQFKESDGMQLPLAIIVAVFCVIAITFLGLGAKLLYQHCFGNLGAFSNIGTSNRRTGVGTEEVSRREPLSPNRCSGQRESLALRTVPLSPRTPLREGAEDLVPPILPAAPPSYNEAISSGPLFKDDPPKYSEIQH